jgi:hypothetical protein
MAGEIFDDALLDDATALQAADVDLRRLAEAGSRVRREVGASDEVGGLLDQFDVPRALIVAGTDARLLRAVLEPWCPVPFVAWPGPGLPGWAGPLDLVVVPLPAAATPAPPRPAPRRFAAAAASSRPALRTRCSPSMRKGATAS